MMLTDLPTCCAACVHRVSQYSLPAWTHTCAKTKPMIPGCAWATYNNVSEVIGERKDY